jgi:agmatinase
MQFIGSKYSFEESDVVILPVPYEKTVCYMPGTAKGPKAIIDASVQLEDFDVELGYEMNKKVKIHTAEEVKFEELEKNVNEITQKNKFPVVLGGEHTVTVPAVKAIAERYSDLSVLQIDAHADLRDEFEGEKLSNACVMRRIREITKKTVQVGIRDMSAEESDYIGGEGIGKYVHGTDFDIDKVVEQLSDNVYITIDLDGFDPSEVPAVGTPQPGGLHWSEVTALLKKIAEKKNIAGFDVVELSPIEGQVASDFFAAKLVYKMIGYSNK